MNRATEVGRRVLAGLAKGRERAIAAKQRQSRLLLNDLLVLLDLDIRAGRDLRTRAGRLARKLGVTPTHVRRLIKKANTLSRTFASWEYS